MRELLSIIWEWRFALVVAAAFLLFCLLEWNKAKGIIYALMLQAKRMAKDAVLQSGQEQEEWVVKKAYQFVPYMRFVPESWTRKFVFWLFHKAKDYMDNGRMDNSI